MKKNLNRNYNKFGNARISMNYKKKNKLRIRHIIFFIIIIFITAIILNFIKTLIKNNFLEIVKIYIQNLTKETPSLLADQTVNILHNGFGIAVYIIPVIILYYLILSLFRITKNKNVVKSDISKKLMNTIVIISGVIILLLSTATLASFYWQNNNVKIGYDSLYGQSLLHFFKSKLSSNGINIIILISVFTGLFFISNFKLLKLLDKINNVLYSIFLKPLNNFCKVNFSQLKNKNIYQKKNKNDNSLDLQKIEETDKNNDEADITNKSKKSFSRKTFNKSINNALKIINKKNDSELINKEQNMKSDLTESKSTTIKYKNFIMPSLDLLDKNNSLKQTNYSKEELENLSTEVENVLLDFGIEAKVIEIHPGPVVTRFEIQPKAGIKASRITSIAKDIARSLSVTSVRVVEIIPGKSYVGLEIPNANREIVRLREILSSQEYATSESPLSLALGKDISGNPSIIDLKKMPHLLAAGTTGSGKSVGINAMILSLLYKNIPENVRLILIDPKMLELSVYEGIPHLLTPVITDMKQTANALRWCVMEMDRRYKYMSNLGVRNLNSYNQKIQESINAGNQIQDPFAKVTYQTVVNEQTQEEEQIKIRQFLQKMPNIVVIIDELADMMMLVGKKVEEFIARIAQKARAAGIHLILATQRPSVDVITGLIKANIPSRIAFQVSSKIDSRTILDQQGAEQLLGYGDMLYLSPGTGQPIRIHGAFVADNEVHAVVKELKKNGPPKYELSILDYEEKEQQNNQELEIDEDKDPMYQEAVDIVLETKRASISYIQRRLKIGFNRAARLIEDMEKAGILGPIEANGGREILIGNEEKF